ncbi:MAG: IgGFc-binding protein [Kofleriaceae bacterium]|nr:IgGFc-binding protein [Myxococcales bacterium]MCB9559874.1 IgGFc-binding protein [Kofleriaceae bacterium]MCB9571486.1 IgGFc-binding protein [Kofleriaceae bacterium]
MSRPRLASASILAACLVALAACGGDPQNNDDDGSPDAAMECASGATQCAGNTFQSCDGGQWTTTAQCPALCDNDLGCVQCVHDTRFCMDDSVYQCNPQGTGSTVSETCSGGAHCSGGACVDLCADAAESKSYLGCDYYAVDLDNAIEVINPSFLGCAFEVPGSLSTTNIDVCWDAANGVAAGLCDANSTCPTGMTCQHPPSAVCLLDAAHSPFAVVVSNPQSFAVNVTIANATGTTQQVSVAAGQVQSLFPQMMGFADQSLDQSMQGKAAYHISSDAPIVAYQFNPLDNVGVFSNDGSLLLPTTTWDTDYYVLSWPTLTRRPDTNDYNSYLTVVAYQDGTMVEVTPSANTRANGAIAAITAGTPTTFTLDAFDVLNLEAIADGDLTGSRVRTTDAKPIGVFGGHEAIVVEQTPAPNAQYPNGPCCADHIEEMMFPTSTWGKSFAVARSFTRNSDADHLRIMAQTAGTAVTFMPAPQTVSGNCGNLGPGQFCEVKITADTAITSTEPILVGQYLESTIWQDFLGTASIGSGDPSLAVAVPTEQFREDYTILVPSQYDVDYVALSTTMTGAVTVDGNDVTGQLAAFGGTYRGGRITVAAGQHTIHCSAGCGVTVMGYSDAVSYLFAGGLDLKQIVVN